MRGRRLNALQCSAQRLGLAPRPPATRVAAPRPVPNRTRSASLFCPARRGAGATPASSFPDSANPASRHSPARIRHPGTSALPAQAKQASKFSLWRRFVTGVAPSLQNWRQAERPAVGSTPMRLRRHAARFRPLHGFRLYRGLFRSRTMAPPRAWQAPRRQA